MPKKSEKKKMSAQHKHFLAILVLFAGFSMYAITSFFSTTDRYIDNIQASSVSIDTSIDWDSLNIPPECTSCPPNPVCDQVCLDNSVPEEPAYQIFSDLDSSHSNAAAVEALYYEGIINGYEDNTFKPEKSINRAELLKILTTAVDADLSGNFANCFNDVSDDWYASFVCYAKAMGWVNGYNDNTYRPANTVIKAEALKIVLETFGYDIPAVATASPFPDVPVTEWYAPYAEVAKSYGIVNSYGNFDAAHEMNRGEFSQMVYNAMR